MTTFASLEPFIIPINSDRRELRDIEKMMSTTEKGEKAPFLRGVKRTCFPLTF